MSDATVKRWWGLWIAGMLMALCVALLAAATITGRWSLGGIRELGAATILWMGTTAYLVWAVLCRRHKPGFMGRVLVAIGLIIAPVIASKYVGRFGLGSAVRAHEIKRALDAGLQRDCERLLRNWPPGKNRIDQGTPEFDRLPASIRMLNPVYLTNEHLDMSDVPSHIGICTCGFGGFATGVRVFQNDQEAATCMSVLSGTYERIAPGVYFCKHST